MYCALCLDELLTLSLVFEIRCFRNDDPKLNFYILDVIAQNAIASIYP